MLSRFIEEGHPQFRVSAAQLRVLAQVISAQRKPLDFDLAVGSRGYGDFTLPLLAFRGGRVEFRRLAFGLLAAVHADDGVLDLPSLGASPTRGIRVMRIQGNLPQAFTYRQRKTVKKYPWYPRSRIWDPFVNLPSFCLSPLPDQIPAPLNRYWGINPDEPHYFSIYGLPTALYRLARCLLDYANTDEPPDFGIRFEVEGGFRGVGPFSYEAAFEII